MAPRNDVVSAMVSGRMAKVSLPQKNISFFMECELCLHAL